MSIESGWALYLEQRGGQAEGEEAQGRRVASLQSAHRVTGQLAARH